MESTTLTAFQSKDWLSFKKENPKVRIRDAARTLQTTEAEIIASFAGKQVTRLNNDFISLWKRMPELGYIMSLTRNEDCVHERKGIFENVQIHHKHMGFVAGPDIDLRMFFNHWAFGFALSEDRGTGFKKSIQIFDRQGNAITKIYLQEESDHQAFDKIVNDFADEEQSPFLSIQPVAPRPECDDEHVDIDAFRKAWHELKDSHDFFPMLRKFKVSRLHALHIGGDEFTRRVSNRSGEKLLYDASGSGLPIMVFTGNNGNVQIHTGPVKKIVAIPGWINVMDPEFNLHLKPDSIAESWVVKKPNKETDVHSLECYDRAGNLIVQFFGKRKPGIPEDKDWADYVQSLN